MADYADLLAAEKTKKDKEQPKREETPSEQKAAHHFPASEKPVQKVPVKAPHPSINQSVNQPINQSINQLTDHLDERLMNKPKGFYISEKLDKRFDKAVEYFEEKHQLRIDRSILLNALLEDENIWDEQSLDRLIDRLINQLTRKLTNR
jgi:hypothetical protein